MEDIINFDMVNKLITWLINHFFHIESELSIFFIDLWFKILNNI